MARCSDLTPSQAKGIDLSRHTGMIAGAGSGKTRVLTERYIALLDYARDKLGMSPSRALSSIIAITYTRKASAEMLDRIAVCCGKLGASEADSEFWRETGLKMAEARVSTIHQFCSRIISEYPIEAGVELDYLEAQSGGDAVGKAAIRFCRTIADDDHPMHSVAVSLVSYIRWEKLPEFLVSAFANRSKVRENFASPAESPEVLVKRWRKSAKNLFDKWKLGDRNLLAGQICDLREYNNLANQNDELATIIDELIHCDLRTDLPESIIRAEKILSDDEGNLRKFGRIGSAKNWPTGTIKRAQHMVNAVREHIETISSFLPHEPGEADLNDARATLLFGRLFEGFLEFEGDNLPPNTDPDFDDLIIAARRVVCEKVVANEIAQNVNGLLVDEFQDTDPLQWEIVSSLADSLTGRVFWVGDPKQSIYGFRGADVTNVKKAVEWVGKRCGSVYPLGDNFRTTPVVLSFINHVAGDFLSNDPPFEFDFLASPQPLDRRRPLPNEHIGSVEIMISGKGGCNPEAEMIARRIWAAVKGDKDGRGLLTVVDNEDSLRPAEWGDIAVMYPTRGGIELELREALLARDIPHYVIGNQSYFESEEISSALDALLYLDDPHDGIAFLSLLRGPLFALADTAIFAASVAGKGDIRSGLTALAEGDYSQFPNGILNDDEIAHIRECDASLVRYEELSAVLPPSRLLLKILSDAGAWTYFMALLNGTQRIANIEKLLRILSDFDSRGLGPAAAHFRAVRISAQKEREEAVESEGTNAVRLMTVHQSKGLEFPVVIASNLSKSRRGSPKCDLIFDDFLGVNLRAEITNIDAEGHCRKLFKRMDIERTQAEEKRLLYVAITRARDHLILSGQKFKGRHMDLVAESLELEIPENSSETRTIDTIDGSLKITLSSGSGSWPIPPKEQKPGVPVFSEIADGLLFEGSAPEISLPLKKPQGRFHLTATDLPILLDSPQESLKRDPVDHPIEGGMGKDWGSAVHKFFELLPSPLPTGAEIEKIALAVLRKYKFDDSKLRGVLDLLEFEDVRRVVDVRGEVRTEERIVLCESGFLITGVIDRYWLDSDGYHIVDFKTDAVIGEERLAKTKYYAPQIEVYRRGLAKAKSFPENRIQASILFTFDTPELIPIPNMEFDNILEKARAALTGEPPNR